MRSVAQLTFYERSYGLDLAFRDEVLRIYTRDGTPISAHFMHEQRLIDADRILPEWSAQFDDLFTSHIGGTGADTLIGGLASDQLSGGGGADRLLGAGGDDTLKGGAGADYLNGGPGSDVFHVDHLGDQVVESPRWAGHDTVRASVDFWMGRAHVEDLVLGGTADVRGVGNGLMNQITGNEGGNILDGGKNNDTLIGGEGNDVYHVRAPGDTVIEQSDEGTDVVRAFRSYLLPDHVERIYLQTEVPLNAIGNDAANLIVGNMADNKLIGRGGRDTLKGLGGADTFVFDRSPGWNNVDRIIDFTPGEDQLLLRASLFGLPPSLDLQAALHFGKRAADGGDHILYDAGTGGLWIDRDGTGPERQMLTFVLEGQVALTAGDLLFV